MINDNFYILQLCFSYRNRMSNLIENLKKTELEIKEKIMESRNYEYIFSNIVEQDEPFYIYKFVEEEGSGIASDIEFIPSSRLTSEKVEPKRICKKLSGDFKLFYSVGRIVLFGKWVNGIINEENRLVFESLSSNAQEVDVKIGDFKGIRNAMNIIQSSGNIPNTMIVNNSQIKNLTKFDNFKSWHLLSPSLYENKRPSFQGMLDCLDIYINRGLPQNMGIICDKEYNNLQLSPLVVKFNEYIHPKILLVKEKLHAHYGNENSLMKIKLI